MKNLILLLTFWLTTSIGFSQNIDGYKRIYKYGEYQKDWALVKSITGNYGFIDQNGKEVVPTIYARIGKFTENSGEFAKVKSITGNYGLIDRNGKEVVPTLYARIGKFGEYANDIALVKTITGKYGFINQNGVEIVEPKYELKEIKRNFKKIYGG